MIDERAGGERGVRADGRPNGRPEAIGERIVDAVPVGIAVLTPDLRVVSWNRWMEERSGLARANVVGKTLREVFPEMDVATLERRVHQAVELGSNTFFDPRAHGHLFPFKATDTLGPKLTWMAQSAVIAPLPGAGEGGAMLVCVTVIDESQAVGAEMRMRVMHAELLQRSQRDSLTEVHNRGYIHERLRGECKRAARHKTPLSVILADLDHFKTLNDTHGHQAGDAALVAAARTLVSHVRDTDLVGRYGGEEFVVVLPDTPLEGAVELAERLRIAIEASKIPWHGDSLTVTASFGIARSLAPHEADRVLGRADAALYNAKRRGRNCCVAADDRMIKVLVADDSTLARKLLIAALPASLAFETLEATDGEAVEEMYKAHSPDIVLLDLNMPTHGSKVLEKLIAVNPKVSVVIVSADVQEGAQDRALAAGAKGFVTKPVKSEALEQAIRACIAF